MIVVTAFVAVAGLMLVFLLPAQSALVSSWITFGLIACLLLGYKAYQAAQQERPPKRGNQHDSGPR